jgi:hypothetical protein
MLEPLDHERPVAEVREPGGGEQAPGAGPDDQDVDVRLLP